MEVRSVTGMRSSTARSWFVRATRQLQEARLFFGHGAGDPATEALWIAAHVLRFSFERQDDFSRATISVAQRREADRVLEERIRSRRPLAYILGEAWLAGLRFRVDERVIVPRSFIAETLENGVRAWLPGPVANALDLCTGSGCLAIILAKHFRRAHVDAADISEPALEVARMNVRDHRLARRVRTVRSDLFQGLRRKRYDLIVSNPPYVKAASMRTLPAEYRYEPELSLAGGKDGLDLIRRILNDAPLHLKPEGVLVCEIGHNRRALEKAFPTHPFIWLSTESGSDEVFLINREGLSVQRSRFQ